MPQSQTNQEQPTSEIKEEPQTKEEEKNEAPPPVPADPDAVPGIGSPMQPDEALQA